MVIDMPEKVRFIIDTLLEHGHEAYAVGGCVRDAILGREPGDWDITTSANPQQVKKLFRRTIDTGIQHGTVTIMLNKEGFEVTTYRIDGEYEDSRHPKSVEFTTNLVEDLKRRDFTINAMAYNHVTGLVDEFNGIEDLKRKRIVCVGNPMERFDEDALRMLRAVRFSGQLGFTIDEDTKRAIVKLAPTIQNISRERIRVEIDKLICSDNCEKLEDAYHIGLTNYIFPELGRMFETEQNNPHHKYNVGTHCLKAVDYFNKEIKASDAYKSCGFDKKMDSVLCWTLLLHDIGKTVTKTTDEAGINHFKGHDLEGQRMAAKVLKGLKFDNFTIDTASRIIKWHDYRYESSDEAVRRALNKIGVNLIYPLLIVQYADIMAQSNYQLEEKTARLKNAAEKIRGIFQKHQCVTMKELAVNGHDLMEIGFKPGRVIGETLQKLLDLVIENPDKNEKEILLEKARSYK